MFKNALMGAAAFAATLAVAVPSHAATTAVTVVAYQFVPGGYLAADPFDLTSGAGAIRLPDGTPASTPTVHRGDSITFTNMDSVGHGVAKLSGPAGTWTTFSLGSGTSATLALPGTFPTGRYVYQCSVHHGMRGSFVVT